MAGGIAALQLDGAALIRKEHPLRDEAVKMRQLIPFVLVLSVAAPAVCPAEQLSVEQLKETLAQPVHMPSGFKNGGATVALLQDATLAEKINRLQLAERLSPATLGAIVKQDKLGPQAQRALRVLAWRSALRDPPAAEIVNKPAPDEAQQRQMLDSARGFVFQTLTHLPDFFATRTTAQFYGVPPELNETGSPVQLGLTFKGMVKREITYRGGREVLNPMQAREAPTLPHPGLESWGEFGPEPAVILMDVGAGGSISFHHWEQMAGNLAAVFRYAVPQAASHYEVNYACTVSTTFHAQPAYHGSLAIDPVTGAILRVTLQADWNKGDPISHVASVIDYGPEDIGGSTYICPVQSLAFSVEDTDVCHHDSYNRRLVQPMTLNQTTFTQYHRLASTHTIFTSPPPETKQEPQR